MLPKFEYKKAVQIEEALNYHRYYEGAILYLAKVTECIPILKANQIHIEGF